MEKKDYVVKIYTADGEVSTEIIRAASPAYAAKSVALRFYERPLCFVHPKSLPIKRGEYRILIRLMDTSKNYESSYLVKNREI